MITQPRIHTLQPYVQKDPGQEGYIDPAELQIIVDHPTFARSMKMTLTGGQTGLSTHQEKGRVSTPANHIAPIVFATAFTEPPIGFHKVYRRITETGNMRFYDVLIDHEEVKTTGVDLVINSSEDLTGIIIEWFYA